MLRSQSCSHRGDCIFNSSPIGRNHIHEALHQIDLMALFNHRLGLIQMIKLIAFIKNRGAATILILSSLRTSLRILPDPTRKGDNLTLVIGQRKHNPVLKSIVDKIILCQIKKTRVHDSGLIKLTSHTLMKIVAFIGSQPDLKMLNDFIRQPTLIEISARFFSYLGRHQNRMIKLRCFCMNIIERLMRMILSRSICASSLHT